MRHLWHMACSMTHDVGLNHTRLTNTNHVCALNDDDSHPVELEAQHFCQTLIQPRLRAIVPRSSVSFKILSVAALRARLLAK